MSRSSADRRRNEDPVPPGAVTDPDVNLATPVQRRELSSHPLAVLGAIALGGIAGAEARYGLSVALPHTAVGWPWATLITNASGCLLIGALMVVLTEMPRPHPLARPLLGVGVLGDSPRPPPTPWSLTLWQGRSAPGGAGLRRRDPLVAGGARLRAECPRRPPRGTPALEQDASAMTALWVALGAAVGAPLCYLVDRAVQRRHNTRFPWGTFTVNMIGSFVLGGLASAAGALPAPVAPALGTGLCGHLQHLQLRAVHLGRGPGTRHRGGLRRSKRRRRSGGRSSGALTHALR